MMMKVMKVTVQYQALLERGHGAGEAVNSHFGLIVVTVIIRMISLVD